VLVPNTCPQHLESWLSHLIACEII
jgi:hypothetical protein